MILGGDKKKIASLIVSRASDSEEAKKRNEAAFNERAKEPEGDQGIQSAAEEIISAIHAKDSGALIEALKSFLEMAEGGEEEDSEEPQE